MPFVNTFFKKFQQNFKKHKKTFLKISESTFFLLKYIKTLSNTGKSIEIPQFLGYIKVTIPKGDFFMNVKDISTHCTRTEFVGTTVLDTIGLVISGIDDTLLQKMNIGTKYHALGLFSSRTGAAGQLTAIDDAVKATNTEILSIELPRDTKGWGGHGNYIVLGGNDISDVRHAVQLALELTEKYAGELYISESGHLEFAFSANAGGALSIAFHAVPGEAFGFMAGSPAAIGLVMADTAMKASSVKITSYMTPDMGTAHSNEVILSLSGDASAVKEAVLNARQIGLELLIAMGSYPRYPLSVNQIPGSSSFNCSFRRYSKTRLPKHTGSRVLLYSVFIIR